jgi:hypothetical protein
VELSQTHPAFPEFNVVANSPLFIALSQQLWMLISFFYVLLRCSPQASIIFEEG